MISRLQVDFNFNSDCLFICQDPARLQFDSPARDIIQGSRDLSPFEILALCEEVQWTPIFQQLTPIVLNFF